MTRTLSISKSPPLTGTVELAGAKNSALRLLAASILTDQTVILERYPSSLLDAQIHVEMLEKLGKKCLVKRNKIIINREHDGITQLNWEGRSIRNTLLILGCLLTRFGAGAVPLPGGCNLGDRKYDLHVMIFKDLGANVEERDGFLIAEAHNGLHGADIHLPIRSTGATENAILCASLAKGITRIWNPHIRPEILDLVKFLNSMGAKIKVFGQEHIEVIGVDALFGTSHEVIVDNMEAITWLIGAAITEGEIEIKNFPYADLEVVMAHLHAAGVRLFRGADNLIVKSGNCFPIEISTGPHPGINSDVQPILAAWSAKAKGVSSIVDLRFPGRYNYMSEMRKMGVKSEITGDKLSIYGANGKLTGATVKAHDLRAGAALALCGLIANKTTTIVDAWQIERGYVDFVEKLQNLGANALWLD
jgi:UDP-N-acetylglucosamine 1-carboxyvinyltransferase